MSIAVLGAYQRCTSERHASWFRHQSIFVLYEMSPSRLLALRAPLSRMQRTSSVESKRSGRKSAPRRIRETRTKGIANLSPGVPWQESRDPQARVQNRSSARTILGYPVSPQVEIALPRNEIGLPIESYSNRGGSQGSGELYMPPTSDQDPMRTRSCRTTGGRRSATRGRRSATRGRRSATSGRACKR